jgi:hypothetical protein
VLPLVSDIVLSFYLGVTWGAYPFRFEVYYGIRLRYTPPHYPFTSIALHFTHAKIYAETDNTVVQDGTWHGAPLQDTDPMRERVQPFEMTHGTAALVFNMPAASVAVSIAGRFTAR